MGKYRKLFYLKKTCGVYQLKIGRKTYIGSTCDLYVRLVEHSAGLRRNTHRNKALQKHFNIHRKIKYRILSFCEVDQLKTTEQFYINKYKPTLNLRNKVGQTVHEYNFYH